jgi:hypothetical protein
MGEHKKMEKRKKKKMCRKKEKDSREWEIDIKGSVQRKLRWVENGVDPW